VYATSVMRQRAPTPSYNVALIDLDEGVRMMSRVEGVAPDAVRIGMRVKARIAREGDTPLVVFDPLDTDGATANVPSPVSVALQTPVAASNSGSRS
jgi:uncharacterized OB-fold protein